MKSIKNFTAFNTLALLISRIGIIPTRKADRNIFLIALKQDYIYAQYGKLPNSKYVTAQTKQNVQKVNNCCRSE